MKKVILILFCVVLALQAQWKYDGVLKFPDADSLFATPMYLTVDANGRVYIASTKQASPRSHDAIYYIDPGTNQVKRLVDFTAKKDTIMVWAIIGITTLKNDLIISSRMHPSAFAGGCSSVYVFQDGDTSKVTGISGVDGQPYKRRPGWGTFIYGIASTKDSTIFGGTAYQGGVIRGFNFRLSAPVNGDRNSVEYGKLIFAPNGQPDDPTHTVPGGLDNKGYDRIRDCATIPNGDYTNPNTPWYTSRNSDTLVQSGNVAVWLGGHSKFPQGYVATKIEDNDNYLTLSNNVFCGLACDNSGKLWVCGNDTTRRWVIGFNVTVTDNGGTKTAFAEPVDELPSATRFINPNPEGAVFNSPTDVIFTDNDNIAYVADTWERVIHKFSKVQTSTEKNIIKPNDFNLEYNYPNPFNPSTTIRFSLSKSSNVTLKVYDILGNEVSTLYNGYKVAGTYDVNFNANNLTSGLYICKMQVGKVEKSIKMLLVK